ncbi:MAG: ATP-dependent Clp protease adaptor ClpS [Holophagaceae bacterium]|nr:ATP-dependent Clp protease adaptor ClpS [Holophagaceae bacterium]
MAQPGRDAKTWTGAEADVADRIQAPPLYRVILHNDNYTTRDFVVYILRDIFRKSEADAISIMLSVHQKGVGVAGIFSFQVAETKVEQVRQLAERHEFPLLCTFEPDI